MQDKHIRKLAKHHLGKAIDSLGDFKKAETVVFLLAVIIRLAEDQRDYITDHMEEIR